MKKRLSHVGLLGAAAMLVLGAGLLAATAVAAQAIAPAVSAFNNCALLYNAGKIDQAIATCDQAIALNPANADAYFVKASALFGMGTIGSDGKYKMPPGTVQALNKYLELAPDGGHVPDVRAMLDSLK